MITNKTVCKKYQSLTFLLQQFVETLFITFVALVFVFLVAIVFAFFVDTISQYPKHL